MWDCGFIDGEVLHLAAAAENAIDNIESTLLRDNLTIHSGGGKIEGWSIKANDAYLTGHT